VTTPDIPERTPEKTPEKTSEKKIARPPKTRAKMPEQPPSVRAANFAEVNLGLEEYAAMEEAKRCLQCKKKPCVAGCPVNVRIPEFIGKVAAGDFPGAADILYADNALPAIAGRVCPQETQCEVQCVHFKKGNPVAIGYLERFVADWSRRHHRPPQAVGPRSGFKVAVVGAGPGGLTAAGELARMGHDVTIFEALHASGGVLRYGIPEFRLPKQIVDEEVASLQGMGVKLEYNVVVGRTITLQQIMKDFDACFIANGAGLPVFLNVPGENLKGVYSANEYLTRVNLMAAYKDDSSTPIARGERAVVFGGGNVAMDSVRTAKRLGSKHAVIAYRRGHDELPARVEEVHHAEEEGVEFLFLVAPLEILGDRQGWVRSVRLQRMELGEPDSSGRRRPVPLPGSEFELPADIIVVAIGTRANPLLTASCPELKINKWGYIEVGEDMKTSVPGVYAGGDIVRGSATVILAMGDGKTAARNIDGYLAEKKKA
jgi:glutamate synthase (NADPH/NADH) small chain